jgi:transposase-like protein
MNSLIDESLSRQARGLAVAGAAQGARRATVAAPATAAPDPQVAAVAKRRQFPAAEKRRIMNAADRCTQPGEIGALLRKEGIYSWMLVNWRKQRAQAEASALAARPRGRKPDPVLAETRKAEQLQREYDRLRRRLAEAHAVIEVQKKLCTLLGLAAVDAPDQTH